MSELVGNCLVAQSGGPTSVINSSIAGAVNEALNHECIEEIYGGLNGVLGILNEDLIDLAWESQQAIRGLRHTPGSALGTCRYKLKKTNEFNRVLQVFQAHNIRHFLNKAGWKIRSPLIPFFASLCVLCESHFLNRAFD